MALVVRKRVTKVAPPVHKFGTNVNRINFDINYNDVKESSVKENSAMPKSPIHGP